MAGCLSVGSACQTPWIAFLECVAESYVASCRTTAVCSSEMAAYLLCTGVCEQYPPSCSGGADSCDCRDMPNVP